MKIVLLSLVFLSGCAINENIDNADASLPDCGKSESIWVCHNPQSEYHGTRCNEECYWVGHMRSENSYCWLLDEQDCRRPLDFAWQKNHCHLLGE